MTGLDKTYIGLISMFVMPILIVDCKVFFVGIEKSETQISLSELVSIGV